MVTGSGALTYELIEGWAKIPQGKQLGYTHGVVLDREQNVYVFNQSQDALIVFDKDGNYKNSWGEEFAKGAHGLHLSREGDQEFLWLVDYEIQAVVKTTLDGKELLRLGIPDLPEVYDAEHPYRPTDVEIGPNGDIYVTDGYGQSWIHQYDAKGEYIRSWGGVGDAPGKMSCPHGIAVDYRGPEPLLYVADRANIRIQVFTLDGKHVGFFHEGLRYPCDFQFIGDYMLIPDLHGVVSLFDKENKLVAQIGDNPGVWQREGWPNIPHDTRVPGKCISPHAAIIDAEGSLYIVEWVSDGRITKFRGPALA